MHKLKLLLFFMLFFTQWEAKSQSTLCEIKGNFIKKTVHNYVYLVDLKAKDVLKSKIIESHFNFKVPQPKEFRLMYLYLEDDSLKGIDYFLEKSKSSSTTSRILALENMEVTVASDIKYATIKGGSLNKDIDEMNSAISSSNYNEYFESHPSTPVSLFFLKVLISVNNSPALRGSIDVKAFYSKLSDSLQNSNEGLEVLKKIEASKP